MRPYVSIIVPVYNVEKYIHICIDSLINQSLKNIEIILIDDESSDSCGYICDEYKKQDNRIKVIHKKNEGLGMARNSGLKIAQGEYIAFVDSDDFVSCHMYEILYLKCKECNADTCICGYKHYITDKKIIYEKLPVNNDRYENDEIIDNILINMIGSEPHYPKDDFIGMSVWKGIYSAELIKKNNLKFVSERKYISEDIIFQIDYFKYSKCTALISQCLYYYRNNNKSLTKTYKKDRFEKEKFLYYELEKRLKEENIYERSILRLNRTFIGRVRVCIEQEAHCNKKIINRLKRIKKITEDKLVCRIINVYPIRKLPFKKCIFSYGVKFKSAFFLYVLCKLNNFRL